MRHKAPVNLGLANAERIAWIERQVPQLERLGETFRVRNYAPDVKERIVAQNDSRINELKTELATLRRAKL
jgi:hypothetical protein